MHSRQLFLLMVLAVVAAACGPDSTGATSGAGARDAGPSDGGPGSGGGGGGGGLAAYPAPHPPMPQAQKGQGPVMASPKLVAILFQGDALESSIDTFVGQLVAATSYWSGATAEYGVGALSAAPVEHLTESAPKTLTDAQVQQWLTMKIQAGGGFPQPDPNTIYAIFYPQQTTVTLSGGALCQAFQGYHSELALSPGKYVSYAVIGRCPPPPVPGVTELDEVTAEASHEFIEAATDPFPHHDAAWTDIDVDHRGWALVGGGAELGDLCAPFPDAFYKPTGITNLVQRVWSNAAAAASHDPCEPEGVSPYFNSAPVLDDTIKVVGSPFGTFQTKGVQIPIGSTKTIELDLYSDAPTKGPWKITVLDLTSAFFGGPPALSFSLDKTTGQNGDKLALTIKALSKSSMGASPFWIQNDLGGATTVWIGLVGD